MSPTAAFLVASPRGFHSTSHSLGAYLLEKLEAGGYNNSKFHVQAALRQPKIEADMLAALDDCDLMVMAFPLYVDCLPAALILALEKIAEHRKAHPPAKPQRLLAIVNNGFPEASQNTTALAICRQFAKETGFDWAGGLSLGGGGAVNGVSLKEMGFLARNITKSLDLSAANLLANEAISDEAVQLMAKSLMPKALYVFMGNRGWNSRAKKLGTQKRLYEKPAEK